MTRNSRKRAGKEIFDYCMEHNINLKLITDDYTPCYYTSYFSDDAPDNIIESNMDFTSNEIRLSVFYSYLGAEIAKNSNYQDELLRILNYINSSMLHKCVENDKFKLSRLLYLPRIAMKQDGYIMISSIIPYDLYELAPEETMYYMTSFCPKLLDILAPYIFLSLYGELTADQAISLINQELFS